MAKNVDTPPPGREFRTKGKKDHLGLEKFRFAPPPPVVSSVRKAKQDVILVKTVVVLCSTIFDLFWALGSTILFFHLVTLLATWMKSEKQFLIKFNICFPLKSYHYSERCNKARERCRLHLFYVCFHARFFCVVFVCVQTYYDYFVT